MKDSGLPETTPPRPPAEPARKSFPVVLTAIASSLLICPGSGHFLLGRKTAGTIYLGIFFGSFLLLCAALFMLVNQSLSLILEAPVWNSALFWHLISAQAVYGTGVLLSGGILAGVYIFAPLELFVVWALFSPS